MLLLLAPSLRACPSSQGERSLLQKELPTECGTKSPTKEQMIQAGQVIQKWKQSQSSKAIDYKNQLQYGIPVVFHVLRTDTGGGDVADTLLEEYLGHLNTELSDAPFSFFHQETNRVDKSAWHYCDYGTYLDAAQSLRVGGKATMNIYFCNIQFRAGGFAFFPTSAGVYFDGIVLESNYQKYGYPASFVRRTVLPHEAG